VPNAIKDQRLAVRLSGPQKQTIERAATVCGDTITEFSVRAIMRQAEDVLAAQPAFRLAEEQWERFNAALDGPVGPAPRLDALLLRPSVFDG
jgi:uncharacterized protein (DUF1778 family)